MIPAGLAMKPAGVGPWLPDRCLGLGLGLGLSLGMGLGLGQGPGLGPVLVRARAGKTLMGTLSRTFILWGGGGSLVRIKESQPP